jgi:tetratricopeptide (TPR) repeat protein
MRKTVTLGTFVLFIFVFNAFISVAQSKRDSLLMLLNKGVRDTSKVILYGELGHYYLTSDLDSSLFYTTTGLRLAEELKYNYGIGKMYHVLGHAMVVNDSLGKARMYYLKANEYFKKAKNLPSQSSVYLVMGNIFLVQNNLPEALDCYIKGQKITDSLNLVGLLPHFYNNLGGVYSLLEDFQLALENFNKALIINEKNGDTETAISILTNMSDIYLKIQDYDQAKQLNRRALQLVQEFPENEVYTISIYRALGGIEYELGNHREALELFKNAL